jgi:hypothetical protein
VVNQLVFEETARNLAAKRPEALSAFAAIKGAIPFEIVNPTRAEVVRMQPYTAMKDAPHFATALKAGVYCMVSLDRKHMIDTRSQIQAELGLRILLPAEFLKEMRGQSSEA